jgi:DNA-directed RNA polymerase specialized sigma24 family protein
VPLKRLPSGSCRVSTGSPAPFVGDEAEDAVQDALLKAYRGYAGLSAERAGPAWLTAILVNCCHDRARARSRRPERKTLGWSTPAEALDDHLLASAAA